MANVQKQFEEFHEKIQLKDMEDNKELREKRDIILNRLKNNISSDAASYSHFNQGSYAIGTGIKPIDGEYDIDVGIKFNISKDDYPDPVEVKKWVYEAVKDHTSNVEMRRPCITVTYLKNGEPEFHVDLAIYAANNSDNKLYLARGKLNSSVDNKAWEVSNPLDLISLINSQFDDSEDKKQFRRIIRYLKRWKDVKFTTDGNAAPTGIALTISAYDYLKISKQYDYATGKYKYDDIQALYDLSVSLLNRFNHEYSEDEERIVERIHIYLPTEPNNDLFEKMTNKQMEDLKKKIENLKAVLWTAKNETDPHEACKKLTDVFGEEFPVPPKEETGQKKTAAIIGTSHSA